ncbi:MAG TPA: PAS domain S-box protein [Pyrinomonadaceae bacterium]
MADLPGPIREFIDALTDDLLVPAFMLVSDEGGLIDWGGALSYGISGLEENMQVGHHVPFLVGLLPLDSGSVFLPKVQTAAEVFADVYLFRRDEGTWILLLDATDDVKKRQALQQRTYDISLRAAELEHEGRTLYDANSRLAQSVKEQTLELSQTVVRLQQELAEGRQREQALSASEARFRSLFDSNVMGIVYFDSTGNIFESNDTFLQLLGYSRDDLNRGLLTWYQIAPIGSDVGSSNPPETLRQQEFTRKDHSQISLLFATAPQIEAPGNRIGVAISFSQPKSTQASS